jgi:hypothetical protein
MDHSFIEETNQIDRYVRGTMPPSERAAFEEHFLDCSDCLAQLEIAKSLRESIRIAAAEIATSSERSQVAPEPRRWRWGWRWMSVGALTGLAAAAFTGVVLYRQLDHTRSELDRVQLAYARQRESATAMLQGAEPVVYTLSLSRGANAAVKTVEIPESPRWVVFSVQIDASQFQKYRAILRNEAGQMVWQKDGLQASSPDIIAIPVLSTTLASGAHTLSLEGLDASGRYVPMSTFPVEAKRRQ